MDKKMEWDGGGDGDGGDASSGGGGGGGIEDDESSATGIWMRSRRRGPLAALKCSPWWEPDDGDADGQGGDGNSNVSCRVR